MTEDRFRTMDEQEQRGLARRLADGSNILNFEAALRIVRARPADAERIVREREEWRDLLDEIDRTNERLHRAALEFR